MTSRLSRRKQRSRAWLIVPLVVGLAAAGYGVYARVLAPAEAPAEAPLQTTTVRRGDIVITATGDGALMPEAEFELSFRTGGALAELAVAVGDRVTAGETLARLDDRVARIQLAQAELALAQAQAKLATTRDAEAQTLAIAEANAAAAQAAYDGLLREAGHTGDRLTSARVNLDQASSQLALAQAAYDTAWDPGRDWELAVRNRATALENERAATLRALDKAKADLEVARAAYNLAVLNLQDDGAEDTARVKLLSAQQALDQARSGADVQAAEWNVEQAALAVESARLALENTVLVAPADGVVTQVTAGVGEAVGSNPLITLAAGDAAYVRFYLEESDLERVAVGSKATIVFDALPNRQFAGQVARIHPTLVTVAGTPAIEAWATLETGEDEAPLPIGLTANVEVIAGEAYKTLLVPVQALRELAPGQYAVFVVTDGGELKLRPIEVGLRDFANAQVVAGLEQGEVVSTGTVATE